MLATVPYGMGIVFLFLGVSNYLVDAYLIYAASVLAGGTIMRSAFGVGESTQYLYEPWELVSQRMADESQCFRFSPPISTQAWVSTGRAP